MKVLLLAESYPPRLNSGARLFSELAEDLRDQGYSVSVLTLIPDRYVAAPTQFAGRFLAHETVNGIRVWRIRSLPVPRHMPLLRGFDQLWMGFLFFTLGLFLGPHRYVLVYSPPFPLTLVGYLLARLWGGHVVLNVQDLYPETPIALGLMKSRLAIGLFETMAAFLYRRSDAITVHSEGNRRHILQRQGPRCRAHVIPNWVDLSWNPPPDADSEFREQYGLGKRFLVSYAGVMGFGQGIEDVLDTASELHELPDVVFVLAGEGVMRAYVEEKVQSRGLSNVILLPTQTAEAYLKLLEASDACLVTLNKDLRTPVVPGKLQSIMAAGKAAVCSIPLESDVWRIVEEAACGLCVEAGRPDRLAEAILGLCGKPSETREMGRRGRAYAEREFNRRRCTDSYVKLLRELAFSSAEVDTTRCG